MKEGKKECMYIKVWFNPIFSLVPMVDLVRPPTPVFLAK